MQRRLQQVMQRLLSGLFEVKRPRDGGHNERGIADGGQVHEKDAIGEAVRQLRCDLQPQAGFAYAPRTSEREQPYLFTLQEILDKSHFLCTSDKWCGLNRQVIGVRVECVERGKGSLEIRHDELKEVALLL